MIAVDFFCGAGGLTRGLSDAGIQVALGIDADEGCRDTYEKNNGVPFLCRDLSLLSCAEVRKFIASVPRDQLLFAGCAPCQPFSKQRFERKWSKQNTLLGHFGRFVKEFLPGHVVMENVPGLAKVKGRSTFKRFCLMLENLGYGYRFDALDAKSFGVPQTRRRLLLIAGRGYTPTLPSPTHGPGRLPFVTVRDAISSYPAIKAGKQHPKIPNHRAAALSPVNAERLSLTPPDGGSRTAWPERLVLQCHQDGYEGHGDVYGRMGWDRPAPTLTCRCHSISNGRYGHPEQNRAVSLREAASIQSFPDDYVFHGLSMGQVATQIGNAVPVKLARAIGFHIRDLQQARELSARQGRAAKRAHAEPSLTLAR